MQKEPIIEFKDLTVGYSRRNPIIQSLNLVIYQHDFFGIIGPNGCGKTTLLRTILGIILPINGKIIYYPYKKDLHFGYVPQIDTIDPLFPLSVSEIVMMGRIKRIGLLKKPKREDRAIVQEALKYCGIEKIGQKLYSELSGGQRQRTLIARALASQPDVLILDEPTHNMDLPSERAILELLKDFHQKEKMTIILVSQLIGAVTNYVQKILLIEKGKILSGTVDVVLSEENLSRLYNFKIRIREVSNQKFISVEE